jgi:Mu transposase, C-terminal domain
MDARRRSARAWHDARDAARSVSPGRAGGAAAVTARPLPRREQRVRRRVAHDAFVDIETVRYSVPYRLVREHVDVAVGDDAVQIFHGTTLVATHRRVREPYARVLEPAHVAGLWRVAPTDTLRDVVPLAALGRSLDAYADAIGGAQ